jgi:SulP family sulfate permease
LLLEKTGMADTLGRENIFDNITAALDRCRK